MMDILVGERFECGSNSRSVMFFIEVKLDERPWDRFSDSYRHQRRITKHD